MLNLRIELLLILASQLIWSGCAPAPPLDSPDMQVIPNLLEDGSISGVHLPSDRGITIPMDSMVDEPPACGMNPTVVVMLNRARRKDCPDGAPCDGAQNCGMSPDVGVDCTDSNCVPMICAKTIKTVQICIDAKTLTLETMYSIRDAARHPRNRVRFNAVLQSVASRSVRSAVAACTQRDYYGGSGAF